MAHRNYPFNGSFDLPLGYRWLVANKVYSLYPWYLIRTKTEAETIRNGYKDQAQALNLEFKDLVPFARRDDGAAIAGFIINAAAVEPEVLVCDVLWRPQVSDPDEEVKIERFPTIWSWFVDCALRDSREWESEETLEDLRHIKV